MLQHSLVVIRSLSHGLATKEQCNQLMDHWHEKEDWLKKPLNFETIQSELWHGQIFCEMSWFWDPTNEYLLPERCPHCQQIVPAAELEEQNSDSIVMQMYCPHCSSEFYCTPRMACGDPRNQPLSFMRMAGTLIQLQLVIQLLQSPSHMHA